MVAWNGMGIASMKIMHSFKLKWVLLILLGGGTVLGQGCASSGTTSGGGGEEGGAIDTGFESGPVDIPVTIAKATGGIDPSTVQFTGATPNLTAQLTKYRKQTAITSGTLSGCLIDRTLTETVRGYVGSTLTFEDETESGCFVFTSVSTGTNVIMTSCNSDDDCGPSATAVISTAGRVHVIFTNITMNRASRIAVSSEGIIAFCGTDADGNAVIGVIPQAGKLPESLLTVTSCDRIRLGDFTSDGNLIYADTTADKVFSLSSAGTTTELYDTEDDLGYLRILGNSVAFSPDAAGKTVGINSNLLTFDTADSSIEYRVFDWLDSSTVLVSEALSSGAGSNLLEMDTTSLTATANVSVASYPISIDCDGADNCFALTDDGLNIGNNNLDQYVSGTGLTTRLAERFVLGQDVCEEGPVFESDFGTLLENQIGFFRRATSEIVHSSRLGTNPHCDPTNPNHIIFECPSSDTPQVCSFRPDFDEIAAGLATHLFILGDLQVSGCSEVMSLVTGDPFGDLAAVSSATTVDLDILDDNGAFYSNSTCTGTPITQATIASGASVSSEFYFKSTSSGTVYFTASDAAGLLTKAAWKIDVP